MSMNKYHGIPLFKGIKDEDMAPMLTCIGGYEKTYNKKEYILLAEEPVYCIGLILSGHVRMIKEDLWGNHSILADMGVHELFGETFVCGNRLSSMVSFITTQKTRVLFLPFDKVLNSCSLVCVFHHRLIENMVSLIANKNMQLMQQLEIVTKKSLREKIYSFLSKESVNAGEAYFTIPYGRVQLAEYLSADRSALTRELNLMKEEGIIDFEKNTFRILKTIPDEK